ncbi:MAG: PA14 domain-containing protein, partial [Bacillota bacterium]
MRTTVRSIVNRSSSAQSRDRRILKRACAGVVPGSRFGLESLESRQLLSLPAGWLNKDVGVAGDPSIPGSANFADGTFTVQASGSDIWDVGAAGSYGDRFHYAYQELDGDGDIVAYVDSFQGVTEGDQNGWAKAGLMFRGSAAETSPQAFLATTNSNGLNFQGRPSPGAASWGVSLTTGRTGMYMKLARVGNTFTPYWSYDGVEWQPYTDANGNTISRTQNMPNKVVVGLAVTSHDNARLDQATFKEVAITATPDTDEPGTPLSMVATGSNDGQSILLNWLDDASNESSMVLQRASNPEFTGTITTINLPADTYQYTDTAITKGQRYYYRLQAKNTSGASEWSNTVDWIAGDIPGLSVHFYNNMSWVGDPVLSTTSANIDSNWGSASPGTGVNADYFSVRYTGKIKAPATGTYTFISNTDDGGECWVNGVAVSIDMSDHGGRDATTQNPIDLEEGQWYNIRFDMYENTGGAQTLLDWIRPDGVRERVPAQYFVTKMDVPEAPTGLTATEEDGKISLAWNDNSATELNFIVEQSTDAAFTSPVLVGNAAENATTISDVLIRPNTTYWYRVRAVNYDGQGTSNVVSIKTSATAGPRGVITSFYNGFRQSLRGDGSLALRQCNEQIAANWNSNAPTEGVNADYFLARYEAMITPTESGLYIFGTSSDDGCRLWVNGELLTNVGWYPRGQDENIPEEINYQALNLVAGHSYPLVYEMFENGGGAGAHVFWQRAGAAWDSATAWPKIPAEVFSPVLSTPAAATNLTATTVTAGAPALNISWTNNALNETSSRLEMSSDGGQTWTIVRTFWDNDGGDNGSPSLISNPGGAPVQSPTIMIEDLQPNTAYKFRVIERNVWGETVSTPLDVTTAPTAIPPAASNLVVVSFGGDNITVGWADNAHNEAGYRIERSLDGTSGWTAVGTVAKNVKIFKDTGLTGSTTYYYRVVATNAAGDAAPSNVVSAGTIGNVMPSPWDQSDIGIGEADADKGSMATNPTGDTWQVTGGGNDIWNTADQFHYVYQKISGDFRFTARIVSMSNSTDGWAKSGVMVRETLDAGSRHFTMAGTLDQQYHLQGRDSAGVFNQGAIGSNMRNSTTAQWVRLERIGPELRGYYSADGVTWTLAPAGDRANIQVFPFEFSDDEGFYIGLAVGAHNNDSSPLYTQTTLFDNVKYENLDPTEVPAAPTNLIASAISENQATLFWKDNANNEAGYHIVRTGGGDTSEFDLPANTNYWIDDTGGLNSGTTYTYKVTAVNKVGSSAAASATAKGTAGSDLPSQWTSVDVGGPYYTGSAGYASGVFDITGGGADIWGANDQFQYVYQEKSGDFVMTARVRYQQNTNVWAKAGIIVRTEADDGFGTITFDPTNSAAPWAMMAVTPANGVQFQWKTFAGGNGNTGWSGGAADAVPMYLRLVRTGSTLVGFYSVDGTDGSWSQLGSAYTIHGDKVAVGLGVTSHDDTMTSMAVFSDVSLNAYDTAGTPEAPAITSITGLGPKAASVSFVNHSLTATSFKFQRATKADFSDA